MTTMGNEQIRNYLVAQIVDEMTAFLMADSGLGIAEALDAIYNSETYAKLMDAGTDIYTQSPSYVYELLSKEYRTGVLTPDWR